MTTTVLADEEPIEPPPLRGRALRFVVVDLIRSRQTMTVAEMVAEVAHLGYVIEGRHSKVISDALRWERARGRVRRIARGVYCYGSAPKTTARRIRIFAARCRRWIVAVTRHQRPPPTPPNRRLLPGRALSNPDWPPWGDIGWLWTV